MGLCPLVLALRVRCDVLHEFLKLLCLVRHFFVELGLLVERLGLFAECFHRLLIERPGFVAREDLPGCQIGLNAERFTPTPSPMVDTVYSLDAFDARGNKIDARQVTIAVTYSPITIDAFTAEPRIASFDDGPVDVVLSWSVSPMEMVSVIEIVGYETVTGFAHYLVRHVPGPTTFSRTFTSSGPTDSKGRSLRELDLTRRLLKYPCSYLIYSEPFDALPATAKAAIYQRLWNVLNGQVTEERYRILTSADRTAIIEILRDTKTDLPSYWMASNGE